MRAESTTRCSTVSTGVWKVCRNEPFEIYDYGFVEDLAGITADELTSITGT